ncbi:YceI family protein [Candidatus Poriferisodalis sp.]|uniref:YceI family protein n=1 Tax=Candidatus Poriferisodalis sp. TaxID=3101277 RepID=UPI003B0295F9
MSPRRRKLLTVGVLLAVIAAAAAFGIWRVLGDAPEEVSLAEAVEVAEQAQEEPAPAATSAPAGGNADDSSATQGAEDPEAESDVAAAGDDDGADAAGLADDAVSSTTELDGIWTVDTETGEFTLDDATGSFAGFRVDEELATIGAFTAVGRTGDVSGTLEIVNEHAEKAEIKVGLASLRTDDSRRDRAVRQALNADEHPFAAFSLTEVLHLEGGTELEGPFAFDVEGDFTVNGITRPVIAQIETQLVGSVIVVVGRFELIFADYDIRIPQVPIVLSAEDHGIVEFQLLLRRS